MKSSIRVVTVLLPAALAGALIVQPVLADQAEVLPTSAAGITGFAPETVTAIYQDRAGFLWIGSREGLALHDGYSFTIYDHDVADPNSISDNSIRTIYEDGQGILWIGTNTGGLNRLDRGRRTFEHFRHDSADGSSLSHDSVYTILEDSRGALWVGTQNGLNLFDPDTGAFRRFMADPNDPDALGNNWIHAIHEDVDGILWVGTVGGGLHRLDPATLRFTRYLHDPGDPATLDHNDVFAIVEGADEALWIGTGHGVQRLDRATGAFRRIENRPESGDGDGSLLVTSLAVGIDGTVWVGTWGDGIRALDPGTGEYLSGRRSLRSSEEAGTRITCLLADHDGTIWAGTWGSGIERMSTAPGLFDVISAHDGGLSNPDATAIFEDGRGRLWIGTYGGALNRRDPGASVIRQYPELANSTLAIVEDAGGILWVGSGFGVKRLDPETGEITNFGHDPDDPYSLGAGWIWAIETDREGGLWIGSGGGGLNRYRGDGTFERILHDPSNPMSLSDDYIISLHHDRRGRLWVGTRSGGLNLYDRAAGSFTRYLPDPADDGSISHHYVTSILEDRRGLIWVGTGGGGINRLEPSGEEGRMRFVQFIERDGLVDDNVMGIVEDKDGSLWISTRRGLSRFDPESNAFVNYGVSDGLPSLVFNVGAAAEGRTDLYFGGSKGAVVISKGTPFPSPAPSPTVLTSILTLGGAVAGDLPPWSRDRLEVAYGEILSFEFAVLDFGERYRHRYEYRLAGLRDDWIDLGSRREITFTNLDPGTYTLQVRGRNDQGVWSETPTVLQIRVVPPFWMTDWFRFALVVAVISVAFAAHRYRTLALEKRNRELQALKDQREKALDEVKASQESLHAAYERLRRLTRRLEAAKEDERKRIARELHDEMGQALTTAKINLQLLFGMDDMQERSGRIEDTIGLVDRMIGHVRALSLDLRPPLLDELGLGPALRGYLETQARRSGITIDVQADGLPTGLPAEIEIIGFRIVQETVTNVFRHADASRIEVTVGHEPGWLDFDIRDDGCGFDVNATLEKAARGHHLGLLGIRERVESIGGTVRIDSGEGDGTRIRVGVPFGN